MKNIACMYLRLSREDGDSSESNSISNQRQIIKSYAKDNDIQLDYEYVDDGFSGSNFERPNFKNMIDELNKGKFNIIIVKDLSRFAEIILNQENIFKRYSLKKEFALYR